MLEAGMSMRENNCKKHKGKIKRGGFKNGRGYCGWYVNKDGKRIFLRSKKEYIYATYLDKNNQHFLMEKTIFIIDGINYKPDFFIYDENYKKLLKIVEVKPSRKEAEPYFQFIEYFKAIGIEYEIEWGIDKIKRRWITDTELKQWDKQYLENYPQYNMSGELNPMYGMKHSEETKKKIGKQTKRYMADEKIKSKQIASIKAFWNSEEAKKIKEKYAALRTAEAEKNNPVIVCKCVFCKKKFEKKLHEMAGRTRDRKKETCSASCAQKYNWEIGKMKYHGDAQKTYKTRIVKYLRLSSEIITGDNLENVVKKLKDSGLVPKHFSLNKSVIEKYFGSVENCRNEIQKYNFCIGDRVHVKIPYNKLGIITELTETGMYVLMDFGATTWTFKHPNYVSKIV